MFSSFHIVRNFFLTNNQLYFSLHKFHSFSFFILHKFSVTENYVYKKIQVSGLDDGKELSVVRGALKIVPTFSSADSKSVWQVLAAVLHFGQLQFEEVNNNNEECTVTNQSSLKSAAAMLNVDPTALQVCYLVM